MESTNTSLVSDRQPPAAAFQVTESAFARIGVISSDEPKGTYFRVEVLGGGCSGYQYNYKLDQTPVAAGDTIIEHAGTKVVVDDVSMGLLAGSVLDYIEDLGSAGFEIKNPNAKSGCGCGNSFSL